MARYTCVVRRLLVIATIALATTLPVQAETTHSGIVHGTIVRVDYLREKMLLREARKKVVYVYILPSTNIQGKHDGYCTIADLKRGANVEVFTSVRGTRTNAEVIKLR